MESCRREICVTNQNAEPKYAAGGKQIPAPGQSRRMLLGASWSMNVSAEGQWVTKFVFGIFVLMVLCVLLLVPTLAMWMKQTMKWRQLEQNFKQLNEEVGNLTLQLRHLKMLTDSRCCVTDVNLNATSDYVNDSSDDDDDDENNADSVVSESLMNSTIENLQYEQRTKLHQELTALNHSFISRMKRDSDGRRKSEKAKYDKGKWLYKCPKRLLAKHYSGGAPHSSSQTGYLSRWNDQDKWCFNNDELSNIQYDKTSGGIVVAVPGIYLFYAQLTFVKFNQLAEFKVFINSTTAHQTTGEVGRCRVRSPVTMADVSLPVTCSTTLLVCLNKQDKIYLKLTVTDVQLDMTSSSSYMGIVRMAKFAKCPKYTSV